MRLGKALILLVFFVLYCSSCTNKTETDTERLDFIESMITNSPDSALAMLQSIDPAYLRNRKNRADFHLLYSIALDKNGIDLKNDSIIKPALRFYALKKPSQHKFQSLYYTARIHENNEEYSNAMECLIKAEFILESVNDRNLAGLHYAAKGRIYNRLMEYKQAAVNFGNAAAEYLSTGNENKYFSNKLRCADCLLMDGAIEDVCRIISEIDPIVPEVNQSNIRNHYLLKLRITEILEPEKTGEILKEYIEKVNTPASIDWLYATRIYLNNGKVDEALQALQLQRKYGGTNASFHYWRGKALALKGKYKESLDEFLTYDRLSGEIGWNIISQDTRFVEERVHHLNLLEKEKERQTKLSLIILVILLALIIAALFISNIRNKLKIESLQRMDLQRQLDELMLEREELAALEARNQEGRKIISERLRIIDQFVMSDAFNDIIFETKASETLKAIIGDRAEFVRQNRLIFNQSAPRFISHLTEKGLTDIEIDHCCLYAIGMNGKMVTTFTNAKRHYHIGSDVRKKLGLSTHDTNISIYIRNLYHQMHS